MNNQRAAWIVVMSMVLAAGCRTEKPGETSGTARSATTGGRLPTVERTMEIPEISVEEAKRRMDADSAYVYLDVRTPSEYNAGHVPGALNIPVAIPNHLGELLANEDFLRVVEAHLPRDASIICGCRSGGRSARAVEMLIGAGYRNVVNLREGFIGTQAPSGEFLTEGWSTVGYPVRRGDEQEGSYERLRQRADRAGK